MRIGAKKYNSRTGDRPANIPKSGVQLYWTFVHDKHPFIKRGLQVERHGAYQLQGTGHTLCTRIELFSEHGNARIIMVQTGMMSCKLALRMFEEYFISRPPLPSQ